MILSQNSCYTYTGSFPYAFTTAGVDIIISAFDDDSSHLMAYGGKIRKDGINYVNFVGYNDPLTNSKWMREVSSSTYILTEVSHIQLDSLNLYFVVVTYHLGLMQFTLTGNLVYSLEIIDALNTNFLRT